LEEQANQSRNQENKEIGSFKLDMLMDQINRSKEEKGD